jgi:hypothetical protein
VYSLNIAAIFRRLFICRNLVVRVRTLSLVPRHRLKKPRIAIGENDGLGRTGTVDGRLAGQLEPFSSDAEISRKRTAADARDDPLGGVVWLCLDVSTR